MLTVFPGNQCMTVYMTYLSGANVQVSLTPPPHPDYILHKLNSSNGNSAGRVYKSVRYESRIFLLLSYLYFPRDLEEFQMYRNKWHHINFYKS